MKFNPIQKTYVMCSTGALGDTISTFPILKILEQKGHIEKLFVPDNYMPLYKLVFDNDLLVNLKDATGHIPREKVTPDVPRHVINQETGDANFLKYPLIPNIPMVESFKPSPTSIHMHLVDCFSISISECILKEYQKDYPLVPKDKLPKNTFVTDAGYAVIAYGATTEHRKMLPEVFNGIKKYLTEKGLKVVLLGKKDHVLQCGRTKTRPSFDGPDFSGCIDLIDKTSLPEALAILHDAKLVVGLDNGLIHLAGMTDTPIVAGYTTVDPYYRMPYRHHKFGWNCYVVEPDSECRYCQTELFETYGIEFIRCGIMTKDCMYSLTLDKWIKQIDYAMGWGVCTNVDKKELLG